MRRHPLLLELNARLWLRRLTARHGQPLTLGNLPDHLVKEAVTGFDTLWVMGVWARTAGSRQQALGSHGLCAEFDRVLPGWTPGDVAGSPYAIGSYTLDSALGPPHALADLGAQLGAMGRNLMVDFVPNHLALDHPWTLTHPQRFITGNSADLQRQPDAFFQTSQGVVLAHGKDPHFPAWADTVQVNIFNPDTRQALIDILMGIAGVADGVRCDMAMLLLNDVFARTWSWALPHAAPPTTEFWEEAISRVKHRYPNFVFVAEAYWGTEGRLVELGFDYVYDKTFYDRLLHGDAQSLRVHLQGQGYLVGRSVRFVENHDEPRSAAAFAEHRVRAAALAATTLPGMRMIFEGQPEGRHIRIPVQLIREPHEPANEGMRDFYRQLIELAGTLPLQRGKWSLLDVRPPVHSEDGHASLLAWAWWLQNVPTVVVINQSDNLARGRVMLQGHAPLPQSLRLSDPFSAQHWVHQGAQLFEQGLSVDVPPRSAQVFVGAKP